MFTGKTPDVTQAQLIAFVTWLCAQAVAFGWITDATNQKLLSITATVVAAAWKVADAWLRGQRAAHADKIAAAKKH